MAVLAKTVETYDVSTIPEDLDPAYVSISPMDTPFQTMIGKGTCDTTHPEWIEVDLNAVDDSNRVVEGEAAPPNDDATLGDRKSNYTQISDKVVTVTSTANAIRDGAKIESVAKQVRFKLMEIKRDMETMLLDNVAASAGSSGTARVSAGLPAFLITNAVRGTGGTDPTTSGSGSDGYPNAAAGDGTQREFTEELLKDVLAQCYESGAEPRYAMVGIRAKQKASTFDGNVTREQKATSKTLTPTVDIYDHDFGRIQIVPNRWQRARDAFIIDPDYIETMFLQTMSTSELPRTGHAERRMIAAEYTLCVKSEKAHGIIADIDPAL